MEVKDLLYEGKAKKVYETGDSDVLLLRYKDQATAFDGLKKENIAGKGVYNNAITTLFFQLLGSKGIATHFIKQVSEREMLVKRVKIIPVEVIIRNIAAGSMSKRLGIEEGKKLEMPVKEFYLKDDALHDPLINKDHIRMLGLASPEQISFMEIIALKVNEILQQHLKDLNIILVDFKLEFGIFAGEVILADEISPDTCRFWDTASGKKLDKDRFRRDLGGMMEAYAEVLRRLQTAVSS